MGHQTKKICIINVIIVIVVPHVLLVDGGERAVIFDRFRGVIQTVSGEGTHFLIPWVQKPIIFSIRSKPRRVPVTTGSKGKEPVCVCVCSGVVIQKDIHIYILNHC